MKHGKKWIALLVCVLMGAGSTAVLAQEEIVRVGILQQVEHNALDAAREGFVQALADNGYVEGKNIEFNYQNASGDQATLQLMAEQLVGSSDIILGIATSSMQMLAAATSDIPLLGTAVTDYEAAGLVASNEAPGLNVTGTTDMNPVDLQIALIAQVLPEAKTLGILYTSSEVNSEIQANIAKEEAQALGMQVVVKTISAVGEVQQAVDSLIGRVDAIYIPTDNVFASAMTVVANVATDGKMPVFCGEANMVQAGGLATYGLNYYKLGYQTGAQAVRILRGEGDIASMPIEGSDEADLILNQLTADMIGLTFPQALLDSAAEVITQ